MMADTNKTNEKQLVSEQRQKELLEAQRLAELEYAEIYRKKLQKEKKRKENELRLQRETEEAALREKRAKEIKEVLEKERLEASARAERASQMLERVIKARASLVSENNEKTNEDVSPAPSSEAMENSELTTEEAFEETLREVVDDESFEEENESADVAENEAENEADAVENEAEAESETSGEYTINIGGEDDADKVVINVTDDRILLNISADGAIVSAESPVAMPFFAQPMPEAEENTLSEEEEAEPTVEEEEIIEAVNPEYDEPVSASCPEVEAIKLLGRGVATGTQFRKYINESRHTIKAFEKKIASLEEELLIDNISLDSIASTMVEEIKAMGAIVEIRCDNLRIVSKFGQRRYLPEIKKFLTSDIERYNSKVSEFATRTGEKLTRLSPDLVERISDGTGAEVIPAFSYKEKYIELEKAEKTDGSKEIKIGELGLSVENGSESESNSHVYKVTPIIPAVTADGLLSSQHVSSKDSYASYLKNSKQALRKIDAEIDKLREKINEARRKNKILDKKLGKKLSLFDKKLTEMDHSADLSNGKNDRGLIQLGREKEKCEDLEKKIELNRAFIEDESKKTEIVIGCLALEREKLLVYARTLSEARATSSNKEISKAKNQLISEISRYNQTVAECALVTELELSPVTSVLAEDILKGSSYNNVPEIACLAELVETVGDESRVVGGKKSKKPRSGYTLLVNPEAEQPKKRSFSPLRTFHGRFFMGGVAPGNVAGASLEAPIVEEPTVAEALTQATFAEVAPIKESSPRMIRRTTVDESGNRKVSETAYPKNLIDDGAAELPKPSMLYEDGVEPASSVKPTATAPRSEYIAPPVERGGASDIEEMPKKKKIKLVPLPPPEKKAKTNAEELRPVTDNGPIYPGNVINKDYVDEDDLDLRDSSQIPSVVEVDDGGEEVGNDVLVKPTKAGLRRHLSYVKKRVRKACRERNRLQRQKSKTEEVASKVKILIHILGVQKKIVDWYCNAMSSCCDLGESGKAKRIARFLRAELKRYNKIAKEYEKISNDKLTRASLEVPKLILEGEDYPIIPKIRIREFEAPDDGVVYGDGVTENADYTTDFSEDLVMTEKSFALKLGNDSNEITRLRAKLETKVKEKHGAWGIDKTVAMVECFGIQKKIVDTLANDLRFACQVSAVKKMQSIKRELSGEIKQYNRLVTEYKTVSGNNLTRASETIPQDIIDGISYTPLPRVGCVYMNNGDDDLNRDLRAMSRNSYGVEDNSGIGGVAFRTKVTTQANKDLSLITKRADYRISMLETERDILAYRFGKEPREIKRERKELSKKIAILRAAHKNALKYENSDNKRYYAVVTANPRTMELKNKRADRTRVAALRSKIISLLNERDIVNGKLMALYAGTEDGLDVKSSINQKWRRIKNKAAAKAKKKQKKLAETLKHMPVTLSEKTKVYNLMNDKIDAESTIALLKYRLRKGKMHKEDKLCARRDIKKQKAIIKQINKSINERMRGLNQRITEMYAISSWTAAAVVVFIMIVIAIVLYIYFVSPSLTALFK